MIRSNVTRLAAEVFTEAGRSVQQYEVHPDGTCYWRQIHAKGKVQLRKVRDEAVRERLCAAASTESKPEADVCNPEREVG